LQVQKITKLDTILTTGGGMVAEENTRATERLPWKDIPDAWAEKGTCPVCGAKPLKAVHLPDLPDYFLCTKCELSFELETNFKAIRVKNIPEKLSLDRTSHFALLFKKSAGVDSRKGWPGSTSNITFR
jgi:rubredoxin